MAKIVYGVSGQGFGHSTRSKEVIAHLIKQGHEVLIFTYGQGLFFFDQSYNVFEVPGRMLIYKNNKVLYWKTLFKNIKQLLIQSRDWKKILNKFKQFDPDLVITDFEAVTAFLAHWRRLPLVSIDNQHQLTHTKIPMPLKYRNKLWGDKLIIRSFVWGADYYLLTSFFKTDVKKKNTFLFPPIVRQEVRELKPTKGDYILVYQTSNFDNILRQLKHAKEKFILFGMNREGRDGNVEFKNYDNHQWLKYLAGCKAIIGTAGSSLIAESLYLNKPYMAVPVRKQMEQIINARELKRMGYGTYCFRLNQKNLNNFIDNIDIFEKNIDKYFIDGDNPLYQKLDKLIDKLS